MNLLHKNVYTHKNKKLASPFQRPLLLYNSVGRKGVDEKWLYSTINTVIPHLPNINMNRRVAERRLESSLLDFKKRHTWGNQKNIRQRGYVAIATECLLRKGRIPFMITSSRVFHTICITLCFTTCQTSELTLSPVISSAYSSSSDTISF